jgi:hypothetical protein
MPDNLAYFLIFITGRSGVQEKRKKDLPPSLFAKWAEDGLDSWHCPARKQGRYAQKP